ncbi:potassium channel protein [Mesotoga prima]|uniref:potassium channel family protein n=1 Tax=Mesotoga prima TaxID=1184387 RepID=UPI002593BFFC|nr:potassium channel protein [Mesotoga prima]HPQ91254.1 potassium channel protein [Mesotoga prima]
MTNETGGAKQIVVSLILLAAVFLIGIIGYSIIEGYSPIDSIFMIMITISTVGYGTITELSQAGKIFTSIVILASITIVVYAVSNITAFLVEGRVNKMIRRRRILKTIEKLENHFIVIGGGDLGSTIAHEMSKRNNDVVIVEKSEERLKDLTSREGGKLIYVSGDATEEETLKSAGVEKAQGLMSCLPDDVDNIFVVLTARGMNKSMKIISKVAHRENINKLNYAGADKVIPIQEIGAHRMVTMMLNPTVIGFLDTISQSGSLQLRFEEVKVPGNFRPEGMTLEALKIPQRIGLIVIATVCDGVNKFNPSASTIVKPGDSLMVLGEHEQVEKLQSLLGGNLNVEPQENNSFIPLILEGNYLSTPVAGEFGDL